jgi:hypothetical protein
MYGQNMSTFERVFRWFLGTILTAWAIAGGPIWAYCGIIILATGSFGFSPVRFYRELNNRDND